MNLTIMFLVVSGTFQLPRGLLSSLCYVESGHNVSALHENDGGTRSHGICQIKLATARSLGFVGTGAELRDPSINIYYAGKLLNYQIKRCGSVQKGVLAYNSGKCTAGNPRYVKKVLLAQSQGK